MKEWENTKIVTQITLDGSDSYDLDTEIINRCTILKILDSSGKALTRYEYESYKGLTDKSSKYAIMGNTLFLSGTSGTYDILYTTYGGDETPDLYPLENYVDEILITIHYWDIIKQMVIVFMLENVGYVASIQLEKTRLDRKIAIVSNKENREHNSGMLKHIQRT